METLEIKKRSRILSNRVQEILNRADKEGRDITGAELAEVEEILAEVEQIENTAAVRERVGGLSQGRQTQPLPPAAGSNRMSTTAVRGALEGNRYVDLFGNAPSLVKTPFASLAEMIRTAWHNPHDERLRATNMMTEDGPAEGGGYLVAHPLSSSLLDRSLEREQIRPRCSNVPMTSASVTAPCFDFTDDTGARRSGLQLRWTREAAQQTDQDAQTSALNLIATKGAIYVRVTSELAEDVPAFDRRLEQAMLAAVAAGLDTAFVHGTGLGMPLGILSAPALITVPKESGQNTPTITENNLAAMCGRLTPSSWSNAVWLASPTTVPQLFKLSQATGPNAGVRTAIISETDSGLRIFGKQVVISDACSTLGSAGDVILCDLSRYLIGLRRDVRLESSIAPNWSTDEVAIRLTLRLNGMPDVGAPTKLRDGASTVSPFVTLETRA